MSNVSSLVQVSSHFADCHVAVGKERNKHSQAEYSELSTVSEGFSSKKPSFLIKKKIFPNFKRKKNS